MKLIQQLLFVALFVNVNVSCAQKIGSFKIKPESQLIDGNKKGGDPTKAVQKIKVGIDLSGKAKGYVYYKLSIDPGNINSKPKLIDSILRISSSDFKKKKLDIELTVKLKELDCLVQSESFKIRYKAIRGKDAGVSDSAVTVKQIEIPNPSVCLLTDESTTVKPYLKSDKEDDGQRRLLLNLKLTGKRSDVPSAAIIVRYQLPLYIKSVSDPKLINDFAITIHKDSFNINGCPKIVRVPVIVQLAAIDKLKEEEWIPIVIIKNDVPDYDHAHKMIIKSAGEEEAGKTTPITIPDPKKEGHSFSHSCIGGKNFLVSLQPDSSIGGRIRVSEGKDTATYHYFHFFLKDNFANWLLNIFKNRINQLSCSYCAPCATYLAERVYEELNKLKVPAAEKSADKPAADEKKEEEKKSGENGADKPKETSDSAKAEKAAPDTFVYHISYADTSIFNLSITKEKDLTILELCKDPKAGDSDCIKERIVDADEKSFNDRVAAMVQKQSGEETIDATKVKPANMYGKYKKDEAAKQVKEKTQIEKDFDNRLTALENEKVTYTDVGIISLRDTSGKIRIHKIDGSLVETEIDSVILVIKDGQLMRKQLLIKTKKGSFWNHDSPVAVNRINERGNDVLGSKNIPINEDHVVLGEVLEYVGDGYVPDDTTIVLTHKNNQRKLSATSNLNSLINFALYTDLTGLLGRRANGIINTDVSGRFITNTRNWPTSIDITPLAFIEANFVLSKFDSKFKSLDSSSLKLGAGGAKDTIDRMKMMQTAWFKGSVKFNLLTWRFFYYQRLSLNAGTRINVVNADSLFKKEKERDVIFFDYYAEAVYSINKLKNFGMDLSLRWIRQKIADKEPFANNGWECIFSPQIDFSYYPMDNRNSRVYFRFNYFANHKKDANNFYQLQFGIKSDLKFGSKK